jgi:4'-phosphopantetheinyl transferase EntD
MIEQILPARAVVEETREDLLDGALFAQEQASVERAVEKRRREFITARVCAHRALARLDLAVQPVLTGEHGEPLWPEGVVGSITHCQGYRACALARAIDLIAIGIDAEPDAALPEGVLSTIACAEEQAWVLAQARVAPQISWDRLLFSAKESIYKALYPLTRCRLGFQDAVVAAASDAAASDAAASDAAASDAPDAGPDAGAFSARLLLPHTPSASGVPSVLSTLQGRWLARDGLVLTAVALPHNRTAGP